MKEIMRQQVKDFRLPRYKEITDVGLYLEQVVKLINNYVQPLGELAITGTMVSNYVKCKLLDNPKKKQYNSEHIIRLLFIALAKNVMSLEDIALINRLQKELYPLQKAYDYFCDEFENVLKESYGFCPAVRGLGDTQSEAKDLLRVAIITMVNKIYLDMYMDIYTDLGGTGSDVVRSK